MNIQPQRYWREIPQRYRLEAGKCRKCGKLCFPPRRKCAACGGASWDTVQLPRKGRLLTYTVVHSSTDEFAKLVPYAVAIVDLGNGVRLTAQVVDVDPGELCAGMPVRLEFRKLGEAGKAGVICYGYKAVPA